jgi:1-acyl-sn-glycerol-3-phosphate acyltransferase
LDNTYFADDSYKTIESKKPVFLDRVASGTSIYFLAKFAFIILRSRRIAIKGKLNTDKLIKVSHEMFNHIEDCGGKLEITGLNNLHRCKGPVVFISNHMSTLETMVFPYLIAPVMDVNFVVKEGNVKNPFFGPIMRAVDPIVVSRTSSREDLQVVTSEGKELLDKGVSIVVFPQGSRKIDFNPSEFNSIGIKLALKAGVQVLPIAIKTDFWENGKIFRDLGPINRKKPIYISIGEPMALSGNGKSEHKAIIEFINNHLKEWGHIE